MYSLQIKKGFKKNKYTAHNTELSHIHIHLITNLIHKNDHTSKNSVNCLKLGYNLQNVIQTTLKSLS
jgi:hypothetical protein